MDHIAIIDDETNIVINIGTMGEDQEEIPEIEGHTCIPTDEAHIGDTWEGGTTFTRPEPPALTADDYRNMARAALAQSDGVAIRCVKAGVEYPEDWKDYDAGLRAIVSTGTGPLPEKPAYPEGT